MVDISLISQIAAKAAFSSSIQVPIPSKLKDCLCVEGLAQYLGFTNYDELKALIYPSIGHLYKGFSIPKKMASFD